jgi:adenylate kinase family enzyme
MKYKYVFLLGRPGCGKSALYRELEKRLFESGQAITFERVDDFPKLWAAVERDDALEKEGKERIYFKRFNDGELSLTNDNLFNVILKEVNSDVLQIDKPDHMIFIEFARSNYVEAVQIFDKSILDFCIVIYMEVSFDICWARNVARHEAAIDQGGDDHLVPRAEMEKRFLYDDQDAFVQYMKDQNIPVVVVNNEADGKEHLKKQVEELFKNLF